MKGYSTLPRSHEWEPHMQFSVIPRTSIFEESLAPLQKIKSLYCMHLQTHLYELNATPRLIFKQSLTSLH